MKILFVNNDPSLPSKNLETTLISTDSDVTREDLFQAEQALKGTRGVPYQDILEYLSATYEVIEEATMNTKSNERVDLIYILSY